MPPNPIPQRIGEPEIDILYMPARPDMVATDPMAGQNSLGLKLGVLIVWDDNVDRETAVRTALAGLEERLVSEALVAEPFTGHPA
jgi:hypothetical protein